MNGARSLGDVSLPTLPSWPSMRRRAGVALALFLLIVAGYMLWFRDSSFVGIERVEVNGRG